jgi:hypothetical protein
MFTTGEYLGHTSSEGTFVYYSCLANDGNNYDGLFYEISFPFYVVPSKVHINNKYDNHSGTDWTVLGKKDDNTYDMLQTGLYDTITKDILISTTEKYKTIRIVITKSFRSDRSGNHFMQQLKIFGDVYA